RREGRIPGCSNQQLAAALAYLADAGQLGTADTSPAPAPATAPAGGPLRVHINRFLDVVYDEQAQRARVLVGGKPFLHCSFVVASIDPKNDNNQDIASIDDLATSLAHDARVLEGPDVRRYLTPAEEVLAHASNLQAWAEHDYDTRLLHSNIAFPLLKELSKAGDEKATRILGAEVKARFREGNAITRRAIVEACGDIVLDMVRNEIHDMRLLTSILTDAVVNYHDLMKEDEVRDVIKHALIQKVLNKIRRISADEIDVLLREGDIFIRKAIVRKCYRSIHDPRLLVPLLDITDDAFIERQFVDPNDYKPPTSVHALKALALLIKKGNKDARRIFDANIERIYSHSDLPARKAIFFFCESVLKNEQLATLAAHDTELDDCSALDTLNARARAGDTVAEGLIMNLLRNWLNDDNRSELTIQELEIRAKNGNVEAERLIQHEIENLAEYSHTKRAQSIISYRLLDGRLSMPVLKAALEKNSRLFLEIVSQIECHLRQGIEYEGAIRNAEKFQDIIMETFYFLSIEERAKLVDNVLGIIFKEHKLLDGEDIASYKYDGIHFVIESLPPNIVKDILDYFNPGWDNKQGEDEKQESLSRTDGLLKHLEWRLNRTK
nr:hypothetical protein [Candidatus Sigynarchaeum springense]